MLKKLITFFIGLISFNVILAQPQSGSFTVEGTATQYYPVTFYDGGLGNNVATEMQLGRSNIHENGTWHGSLISTIKFHSTSWGSGSAFILPQIAQTGSFIAGWKEASTDNGSRRIIIWLKGATTYYYSANATVDPGIYDGVTNPLPYHETGLSPSTTFDHSYKTSLDNYVESYIIAPGKFGFWTANENADIFTNNSNSKIGVGLLYPKYKIDIAGSLMTTAVETEKLIGFIRPSTAGVREQVSAAIALGSYEVSAAGKGRLDILVSGQPTLLNNWAGIPDVTVASFNGNGNVGIGTTSPDAQLEVSNNANNATLRLSGNGNAAGSFGRLEFANTIPYSGTTSRAFIEGYRNSDTDNGFLAFATADALGAYPQVKMLIYPDGRIGFGYGATPDNVYRYAFDGNLMANSYSVFGGNQLTNTGLYTSTNMHLKTWDGTAEQTRLFINAADGRVGIGTTTLPTGYKLAVNGNIIAEKVTVKLAVNGIWPDYVFDESYRLQPLNELEKFIQKNKHLPEIPSAAEVEKNGADVGANQALLLKKIEELTLYIIDQNKKIEALETKVNNLSEKK